MGNKLTQRNTLKILPKADNEMKNFCSENNVKF